MTLEDWAVRDHFHFTTENSGEEEHEEEEEDNDGKEDDDDRGIMIMMMVMTVTRMVNFNLARNSHLLLIATPRSRYLSLPPQVTDEETEAHRS